MILKKIYLILIKIGDFFKDFSLLFARLLIAYGFYEPALNKFKDIQGIADWFSSIGIPLPFLNAYVAATTEALGVLLLTLGLFTRAISIPLMVVMIVAITTVHLPNGFSAGDNGFEIPLYYLIFLFIFFTNGAGNISLDRLIFGKKN